MNDMVKHREIGSPRHRRRASNASQEAEEAVRTLIRWAGDDPEREGLLGTPDRVVRAYARVLPRLRRRTRPRSSSAPSRRPTATTR